jgi:hypothetical protein
VTVPITWIAGSANTPVNVTPTSISVSAAPGQTAYSGVMIDNVPVAATVLLALASADPMIQVNAVVYLPENRPPTPQELAQMPVTLHNRAQKNGIVQYRQLSSNELGAPFDVPATARLTINVDFRAPAVQPPNEDVNTLIILGNTWERTEVPVNFVIGAITAAVSPNLVSAAQGESASFQATLTSVSGPHTDVSFSLGQAGFGTITPGSIHLLHGTTITPSLTLSISPAAPAGTYPTDLNVQAFDNAQGADFALHANRICRRIHFDSHQFDHVPVSFSGRSHHLRHMCRFGRWLQEADFYSEHNAARCHFDCPLVGELWRRLNHADP